MEFHILDVGSEGVCLEAEGLLRARILIKPDEAASAWNHLIAFCSQLAQNRSGCDRAVLQGNLERLGINLKTTS